MRDLGEHFKLKFPFYMMDIAAFEYKLNQILKENEDNPLNQEWHGSLRTGVFTLA